MRADRLLSLMMLLQTRGQMTAVALADALEVTPRTIYRDVEALSSAGIPIYANGGPGGGYALLDSYRTTLTGLHAAEIKALFMMTIPGPLADLGVNQSLQSAILKLTSSLPNQTHTEADFMQQRVHLDAAAWFRPAEAVPLLSVVQTAVWQDRRLHITYRRPSGTVSKRLIEPYALVAKAAVWYLVAATADGMRVYRMKRLQTAELSSDTFTRPDAFDLKTFWQQWVVEYTASLPQYQVTLRVTPGLLTLLPYILGEQPLQIFDQTEPDGAGWHTIEITFETREKAAALVLGMGPAAEVITPAELRQQVLTTAKEIVGRYEDEGSSHSVKKSTHAA